MGKNKDLFEFEVEFYKILDRFALRIKNQDLIEVHL